MTQKLEKKGEMQKKIRDQFMLLHVFIYIINHQFLKSIHLFTSIQVVPSMGPMQIKLL